MSGFNAGRHVEPIEWDFTDFVPGAKGISPEPSTQAIERYHRASRNLAEAMMRIQSAAVDQEVSRQKELSPEQALEQVRKWGQMSLDQALQVLDQEMADDLPQSLELITRYAELVDEVTNGCPNAQQIMGLPHRIRGAFFGWFTRQLIDPELVAAGTKSSLSLVQGNGI